MRSMPRVLEGLKHRYGGSASKQVGDGPEPLHDYLDVSLLLRSLIGSNINVEIDECM